MIVFPIITNNRILMKFSVIRSVIEMIFELFHRVYNWHLLTCSLGTYVSSAHGMAAVKTLADRKLLCMITSLPH